MAELPGLDGLACMTRLLSRAFPGLRRPENGIILDKQGEVFELAAPGVVAPRDNARLARVKELYLNPPKNTPSTAPAWMEMNLASWALRPGLTVVTKPMNRM